MHDQRTVLHAFVDAVQRPGLSNNSGQVPPVAILWPDKDRRWECLQPLLRECLPHLFKLGVYRPEERTGPAYWLRCVIAGVLPSYPLEVGVIPILYLPDLSRSDLRPCDEMPKLLQPLAELNYRGVWWTQKNGRDWTPNAFLQATHAGLGIPLQHDHATRKALHRALPHLFHEPIAHLQQAAPLHASFFDALLDQANI